MIRLICALILVLLISTPSLGQQSIVGTYKIVSHEVQVNGTNEPAPFNFFRILDATSEQCHLIKGESVLRKQRHNRYAL